MKIYLGPYKNYFGIYQFADLFPISENNKDRLVEYIRDSWFDKTLQFIDSLKKRIMYVKIDDYDTWNLDHTLALIILPALKQVKADACSRPLIDDKDIPKELIDATDMDKWHYILDEMIFAFKGIVDDSWEDNLDFSIESDRKQCENINKRIANGLVLFGTYYRALWD